LWKNLQNVLKVGVLVAVGKFRKLIEDRFTDECFSFYRLAFCIYISICLFSVISDIQGSSVKETLVSV
jgi:hypothetical protein